ncbi:hypothetical protein PF011_g32231 [Phytophthora fragariae]|uniref:Uncharacterized protein n=1 Tax=Phytophthora fragariae TaxID=53985 RepID=A0A6A3GBM7_9STRA|nr:hypothetical protein PF011_g32231 [Phytophthora fragariae]
MAYTENAKVRNALFKRRLEQEGNKENIRHVRWLQEQKATKREQEAVRRHELFMTLMQQGKQPQEIKEFLCIAGLEAQTPPSHMFSTQVGGHNRAESSRAYQADASVADPIGVGESDEVDE